MAGEMCQNALLNPYLPPTINSLLMVPRNTSLGAELMNHP